MASRYLFVPSDLRTLERLRSGERIGPVRAFPVRADAVAISRDGLALAVDSTRLAEPPRPDPTDGGLSIDALAADAVCELDAGFKEKECAGGVLVDAASPGGARVVLIRVRRRDGEMIELPKGHLEGDETPAETALREVREELGLGDPLRLEIDRPLPPTHHVFRKRDRDDRPARLKTTHWFLLRVDPVPEARDFAPQGEEGVLEALWVPLAEAAARVGYDNLRAPLEAAAALLSPGVAPAGGGAR